jgi:hypothetical protein
MLAYDADDSEAPARLKASLGDTPLDLLFANAGAGGAKASHSDRSMSLTCRKPCINALAP